METRARTTAPKNIYAHTTTPGHIHDFHIIARLLPACLPCHLRCTVTTSQTSVRNQSLSLLFFKISTHTDFSSFHKICKIHKKLTYGVKKEHTGKHKKITALPRDFRFRVENSLCFISVPQWGGHSRKCKRQTSAQSPGTQLLHKKVEHKVVQVTQIRSKIHTALVYDEDRGSRLREMLVPIKKRQCISHQRRPGSWYSGTWKARTYCIRKRHDPINELHSDGHTAIRVVHAVRVTRIKAKQCTAYKGCMPTGDLDQGTDNEPWGFIPTIYFLISRITSRPSASPGISYRYIYSVLRKLA